VAPVSHRWWAWIGACGLVLGLALAVGASLRAAERSPVGWTRTEPAVPFRRADLMGELPEGRGAWSLDHFMAYAAVPGLARGETLSLTAQLPSGGELQLFPAGRWSRPSTGAPHASSTRMAVPQGGALILRRSRGGLATGMRLDPDGESPLSCTGTLSVPGDAPFTVTLTATDGGFDVTLGDSSLRCADRLGGDQVVIRAGLQRVRVSAVNRAGLATTPGGLGTAALWVLLGLGGALSLASLERWSGADPRKIALTSAPLWLCGLALGLDGRAVVEQLRAPGLDPAHVGIWIGLAPALAAKLLHLTGRLSGRSALRGLGGPLVLALGTALAIALSRPLHWGAVVYLPCAALALGGVVWVNVRTVRLYNLLSLVGVATAVGMAEYGVRFTAAGQAWSPTGAMAQDRQLGWTNTALKDFEQLDAGEHTTYPIEGFPVAFPEASETPRIACFGGSSTGGAYQNDDLEDFYPARLQELLGPRAEVLNQGVGGWATFHIRTYLARTADTLDPDIITVYAGHNDLLTRSRLPYKDLYARWEAGALTDRVPLASIRLYQGLRYLVQSLAGLERRVAVPLDHAAENLEAIASLAEQRGAKVLLIPEAVHPDPGPLVAYAALMDDIAQRHGHVAMLDGSTHLLDQGAGMFIDDCHLTDAGHRSLAGAMARSLRELGWVQ